MKPTFQCFLLLSLDNDFLTTSLMICDYDLSEQEMPREHLKNLQYCQSLRTFDKSTRRWKRMERKKKKGNNSNKKQYFSAPNAGYLHNYEVIKTVWNILSMIL